MLSWGNVLLNYKNIEQGNNSIFIKCIYMRKRHQNINGGYPGVLKSVGGVELAFTIYLCLLVLFEFMCVLHYLYFFYL